MNKVIDSIRQFVIYLWRYQGNHSLHVAVLLTMCIAVAALTQVPASLAAQQATNASNAATTGTAQPAQATMDSQSNDPVAAASIAQPNEDIVPDPELCGANGYRIEGTEICIHGEDEEKAVPEEDIAGLGDLPITTVCLDDGISGKRVQVMYVRPSDRADRYAKELTNIRTIAANISLLFDASAASTGGNRAINYVVTPDCKVDVLYVDVAATDDDTFAATIRALNALGYNSPDRKYLIFMDSNIYCGIASTIGDSQPGAENKSNLKTGYARVDYGCWNEVAAAHELVHTLGGIQHDAPHSTGGWHCTDEQDVMCYSDSPYYPAISIDCNDGSYASLLDCGNDDYYNANPAADSYLATHWNVANSQFLIKYDEAAPDIDIRLTVTPTVSTSDDPNEFLVKMNITGAGSEQLIGSIERVEFYQDGELLDITTGGNFETPWLAPAPGGYTFEARIYWPGNARLFQELRVSVSDSPKAVYLPVIVKN